MRAPLARRAFSLLELLVVLALLTALGALVGPGLARFTTGRAADEEMRRLHALLDYARAEASSRGARTTVWIGADGLSYGIEADLSALVPRRFETAERVTISARNEDNSVVPGRATFVFWPDGMPDETNPARIVLLLDGEPLHTIALDETATRYEVTTDAAP
jgi:prepilin-type N-terminal cleavage/methylation domain-containing protein